MDTSRKSQIYPISPFGEGIPQIATGREVGGRQELGKKAISVSSHNGAAEHIEASQSLLSGSERGLMQTPLDLPLVQFGALPTPIAVEFKVIALV